MSIVLCGGAWSFGTLVHCIRQRRAGVEIIVAAIAGLFIAAQLSLILRLPLPSILPWSVIAIAGTATVVSFAAIAEYFPPELTGRANGALNVLHFGWAFVSRAGPASSCSSGQWWMATGPSLPIKSRSVSI